MPWTVLTTEILLKLSINTVKCAKYSSIVREIVVIMYKRATTKYGQEE